MTTIREIPIKEFSFFSSEEYRNGLIPCVKLRILTASGRYEITNDAIFDNVNPQYNIAVAKLIADATDYAEEFILKLKTNE